MRGGRRIVELRAERLWKGGACLNVEAGGYMILFDVQCHLSKEQLGLRLLEVDSMIHTCMILERGKDCVARLAWLGNLPPDLNYLKMRGISVQLIP